MTLAEKLGLRPKPTRVQQMRAVFAAPVIVNGKPHILQLRRINGTPYAPKPVRPTSERTS